MKKRLDRLETFPRSLSIEDKQIEMWKLRCKYNRIASKKGVASSV